MEWELVQGPKRVDVKQPKAKLPVCRHAGAQIAVTCFRGLRIIDVSFSETVNLDITGNHRGMNLTAVTLTIDGKTHGLDGTRFSNPTTSMTIPLGEDPTGVERNLRRGSRAALIVTWMGGLGGGNARFSWSLSGSDRAISQVRGC